MHLIIIFSLLFVSGNLVSGSLYTPTNPFLDLEVGVPPARFVVIDNAGRRTGVDPKATLNEYGEGDSLNEIPGTAVSQIDNDGIGGDSAWELFFSEPVPQILTVELTGITRGTSVLSLKEISLKPSAIYAEAEIRVLMEKGAHRKIVISPDLDNHVLTVNLGCTPILLVEDTETVCSLGVLNSSTDCGTLGNLASTIQNEADKGDRLAEKDALGKYLLLMDRELKNSRNRYFENIAALNALKDEAGALLEAIDGTCFGVLESDSDAGPKKIAVEKLAVVK